MKELEKAYEAVKMLESLGLPVSKETLDGIAQMEKDNLCNEIIPLIKQELEPLVGKMRNGFQLSLTYSKGKGLDISVVEPQRQVKIEDPIEVDKSYRNKYAGAKNVEQMGFEVLGKNLVSDSLFDNEKYKKYQREVSPGLYVCTYCNTARKMKILNRINRELKLNLVIEEVMIEDID